MKKSNLTPELLKKAKSCKNAEELIALAKENNVSIDSDEIKSMLNTLPAELDDESLSAVSGGFGPVGLPKPKHQNFV